LRALMDGLAEAAGTPALIIWHAGCPPFVGVEKTESAASPAEDAACAAATARTVEGIRTLAPENLVMVGRWRYYADGQGIGRDAHNRITLTGADYATAWEETVAALAPAVG